MKSSVTARVSPMRTLGSKRRCQTSAEDGTGEEKRRKISSVWRNVPMEQDTELENGNTDDLCGGRVDEMIARICDLDVLLDLALLVTRVVRILIGILLRLLRGTFGAVGGKSADVVAVRVV